MSLLPGFRIAVALRNDALAILTWDSKKNRLEFLYSLKSNPSYRLLVTNFPKNKEQNYEKK